MPSRPLSLALGACALLIACNSHSPELAPGRVSVDEVTTTDFLVSGLPYADYLETVGTDLRLRDEVAVWIGEQRAEIVGIEDGGIHVRLSAPMPLGRYDLGVSGPGAHTASGALEVFARSTDAPDSAIADGGPSDATLRLDAGPGDAGPGDAGPADAGPADAGEDVPSDVTLPPAFCDADDEELVACYEFESDGSDGSAAENDLTLSEVSFAAGVSGEALVLNEESSAAVLAPTGLNFSRFTIELWVRASTIPTEGRRGLIDKNGQYGVFLYPDGTIRFTAGVGVTVSSLPITPGEWTHIACTMDGLELRMYRNGTKDNSAGVSGNTPSGSAAFHVGEDSPGGGDQFIGRIESLRAWSEPRNAAEICAAAGEACTP